MAGPRTTKMFYERNRQAKDKAYDNAVEIIKQEERALADAIANEKKRKEVEEFLKDPKVKAAMDAPLPSNAQLKADLAPLDLTSIAPNEAQVHYVDSRALVLLRTGNGAALGAYFNYIDKEVKGVMKRVILKTSEYYAVEEVGSDDWFSFMFTTEETRLNIELRMMKPQAKDTFADRGPIFRLMFIPIP
jgi:hypothetical protein